MHLKTTSSGETRDKVLEKVKSIMFPILSDRDVKVYLFGSWARQEEKRTSDIDIAIEFDSIKESDRMKLMQVRDALEQSTIPYQFDIIHMNSADPHIVDKIFQEGILWDVQTKG